MPACLSEMLGGRVESVRSRSSPLGWHVVGSGEAFSSQLSMGHVLVDVAEDIPLNVWVSQSFGNDVTDHLICVVHLAFA